MSIQNIGDKELLFTIKGKVTCVLDGNKSTNNFVLKPGSLLECLSK